MVEAWPEESTRISTSAEVSGNRGIRAAQRVEREGRTYLCFDDDGRVSSYSPRTDTNIIEILEPSLLPPHCPPIETRFGDNRGTPAIVRLYPDGKVRETEGRVGFGRLPDGSQAFGVSGLRNRWVSLPSLSEIALRMARGERFFNDVDPEQITGTSNFGD